MSASTPIAPSAAGSAVAVSSAAMITKTTATAVTIASEDKSKQKKFHGFIAGVFSGVTKLVVGHPFGNRWLGSLSIYRLFLQDGDPNVKLTPFWSGVAGIGAGVTVSFIAAPIEHVKARLQVQYDAKTKLYSGPIDCARQLVRNNGITGLWKGLVATLWFRSWFFMWWSSYEIYADQFRKHTNMSEAAINFWAGGLGANTFWVFSFPCDVVKNKIMTQPDVKNPPFPTIVSCFKHVYRTEGGIRSISLVPRKVSAID
ncbi:hypothetical protein BGW38_008425 [Lunasporangiospora selenospora]|uniref:Uncharacterized protein n=1 Tax=Lunasporangiospora selenospora TaxID=979761 RepID=A0A9P6G2J4_9FUNG|nr:hypothetical protein BGW38_008425 [Lunasporangiospora selenospora]